MIMKKLFAVILLVLPSTWLYAQKKYESDFFRGNLSDKTNAVIASCKAGQSNVAFLAMDFVVQSNQYLGNDPEYIALAQAAVSSIDSINCMGKEKQAAKYLTQVFQVASNEQLASSVIKAFENFPSGESLALVNSYFYKNMQNQVPMNPSIESCIEYMKSKGNASSFNMLFISDVLDVWPSHSALIQDAYGSLAEGSRKEIAQLLGTVSLDRKAVILSKLDSNAKISKKITADAAENILLSIITIGEENKPELSAQAVELSLECIRIIAENKWTRASILVTRMFNILKDEYEANKITGQQFAEAIKNICQVASYKTTGALSSYLDFLNRCVETNQHPDRDVVLAVINSLGDLGDKTAFDYLYSASTLNYTQDVVEAAKQALDKLKW